MLNMLRSKVWIFSGRAEDAEALHPGWPFGSLRCLATPQGSNLHAAPVSWSAIGDTGELFESARLMALLDRVRATLPLHAQQDMDFH